MASSATASFSPIGSGSETPQICFNYLTTCLAELQSKINDPEGQAYPKTLEAMKVAGEMLKANLGKYSTPEGTLREEITSAELKQLQDQYRVSKAQRLAGPEFIKKAVEFQNGYSSKEKSEINDDSMAQFLLSNVSFKRIIEQNEADMKATKSETDVETLSSSLASITIDEEGLIPPVRTAQDLLNAFKILKKMGDSSLQSPMVKSMPDFYNHLLENQRKLENFIAMFSMPGAIDALTDVEVKFFATTISQQLKAVKVKIEDTTGKLSKPQNIAEMKEFFVKGNTVFTDLGKEILEDSRFCGGCGKTQAMLKTKFKVCGRCKKMVYCSEVCQKKVWKEHKIICVVPAAATK